MAKKKSNAPNYKRDAEFFWGKGAKNMYKEFKKIGLSDYQIAGLLGSIGLESSFDHAATNGSHWGYVQNSKDFVDAIKKYYGGYGHKEQMQFLLDGLSGKLRGSSGKKKNSSMYQMQQRFNDYLNATKNLTNPVDTARAWERFYERSGGQAIGARQSYSQHFYDLMKNLNNAEVIDADTLNNIQKVNQIKNANLMNITQPNDATRVLPRPNLSIKPVAQTDNIPMLYNDNAITPTLPESVPYINYAYTRPTYSMPQTTTARSQAFQSKIPEEILPDFDFYNLNLGNYLNNGEYFT